MNTLQPFHVAALQSAHALMQAAAEVGKPYACWANHRAVGGARTADHLVDLGLFDKRLGFTPGDVDTFFYRITDYGCLCIGRPNPLEDLPVTDQPTVHELRFFDLPDGDQTPEPAPSLAAPTLSVVDVPQPAQPISPSLPGQGGEVSSAPGGEVHSVPGAALPPSPLEGEGQGVRGQDSEDSTVIAELRADRDALIEQIIALETRVKAAEAERDAARKDAAEKPSEDSRADYEKRISSLSELYMNESAKVLELKGSHALAIKAAETAQAERDALLRERRAFEQQIAAAHGTDAQVECDFVFDITPHDLRARWLAGWSVEHYALDGSSVNVILRRDRKPGRKGKRAARSTRPVTAQPRPIAPAPSAPAPSASVLTDGEVLPPSPLWRGAGGEVPEGEGLGVRASVLTAPTPPDPVAIFKRNLAQQFASNPVAPMRAIRDIVGSQPV